MPNDKEDIFQISLKLPVWLYEEIKNLANINDRTVSNQIRLMLKKYIEFSKQ